MSQIWLLKLLDKHYPKSSIKKYRLIMTIETSENDLIDIMKKIPSHLELSSLPKILGDKKKSSNFSCWI